jgi:hypothetical protein
MAFLSLKRRRLQVHLNDLLGTKKLAPRLRAMPSVRGGSMLRIVLATARPNAMQAFAEALSSNLAVNLQRVISGAEAWKPRAPLPPSRDY